MTSRILNKKASNASGARSDFLYGSILDQKRYFFVLDYIRDKVVLDCASGVGWGAYLLGRSGAKYVYGVDISESACQAARQYYCAKNISCINGELENSRIVASSIDVAVCFETIEHLERPIDFLKSVHKYVVSGGLLFLSTPNAIAFKSSNAKPWNPYHFDEYTQCQLRDMLAQSGWQVNEYRGQYLMKDDLALTEYRLFIRRYWLEQNNIKKYGFLFRLVAFFYRRLFAIIEPAYREACDPLLVEKGEEPAYHYFICSKV